MANPNPNEINHIGVSISVPDIEEAIDWYKKIFDFKVIGGPDTIQADESTDGLILKDIFGPHMKAKVAWLVSGNHVGFEIFQFIDPKAEIRSNSFEYWKSGFFHICITDLNIEEITNKICKNGGRQRSKVHKFVRNEEEYKLVFCEDPYGNVVEIFTHDFQQFITNT